MNMEEEELEIKKRTDETVAVSDEGNVVSVKLPQCCIDAHDDCPHVAKEQKDKKTNIGL